MDPFIHLWNTYTLTSIVQAAAVGEDAGDDVGDDGDEDADGAPSSMNLLALDYLHLPQIPSRSCQLTLTKKVEVVQRATSKYFNGERISIER